MNFDSNRVNPLAIRLGYLIIEFFGIGDNIMSTTSFQMASFDNTGIRYTDIAIGSR